MKVAYFDCFSGISGDMILGALIDAGLSVQELESELSKLKISGFKIRVEKALRRGISGIKFNIDIKEPLVERYLKDIMKSLIKVI